MLRTLYYLYQLRKNVHRSTSSIESSKQKQLQKLLRHVYDTTAYYHELFNNNKIKPQEIQVVSDIQKIPILTKSDVRNNSDAIISNKYKKAGLIEHQTSGSTGIPLSKFNDKASESYNKALRFRSYFENGFKITDQVVEFTSPASIAKKKSLFHQLGLFRKSEISIYDEPDVCIRKLNTIKPQIIISYPSILYLIAKNSKISLEFKPKRIFTSSELLTSKTRKTIEDFFGTDVIDTYGSEELNRLAWECEKHQGYHLDEDMHIIEFLDEKDQPVVKGLGRIVVTSLYDFAFPMIRYDTGDYAFMDGTKCDCGRTFSVVQSIVGRSDDFIKLPSGAMVSPRHINIIEDIPGVGAYRTIQEKIDLIRVLLVKDESFSAHTVKEIKKRILEGCHNEKIKVDVKLVDAVKPEENGKVRTVISKVK